jgi:molybdopterin-guanine dinucleotide biosynthesis protein A
MVVRAADALAPHVAELVTVAPDTERRIAGTRALADSGRGPLGALAVVLERAAERGDAGALVLACDLPLVCPALIGALVTTWSGEDVVAPLREGRLQPLCGLWSVSALSVVRAALAADTLSVMSTVAQLRLRPVPEREWRPVVRTEEALLNVNTRSDLTRARSIARCA